MPWRVTLPLVSGCASSAPRRTRTRPEYQDMQKFTSQALLNSAHIVKKFWLLETLWEHMSQMPTPRDNRNYPDLFNLFLVELYIHKYILSYIFTYFIILCFYPTLIQWFFSFLDFLTAVSEVLEYDNLGRVWQCTMCWMSNKDKARVRAHAEVHFKGFVHSCPHCGIQKKTSTALRMHIISYHKNTQWIN